MNDQIRREERRQEGFLFVDLTDGQAKALAGSLSRLEGHIDYHMLTDEEVFPLIFGGTTLIVLCAFGVAPRDLLRIAEKHMSRFPNGPSITVITDLHDRFFFEACYRHGIKGMLHADMSVRSAQQALHLVANGGTFVPPWMLRSMSSAF